jgi:hypothetical protein
VLKVSARKEIIKSLVEKCENKFDYYDVVNEIMGTVDFDLLVEFILDCIFGVWANDEGVIEE